MCAIDAIIHILEVIRYGNQEYYIRTSYKEGFIPG